MDKDLGKLRRRPFLFPLIFPLVVFITVVAAAAWLFDARASTVIVVVRHAETDVGAAAHGDAPLSVDGRERAARLARMLSKAQPVRGIDAIFASELRRTQQTVTPLSEVLALPVNIVPSATWADLPRKILRQHRGEYVLVSGSATTVPALIKSLTGEEVSVREDEYDAMFIVFAPQVSKRKVVRLRY